MSIPPKIANGEEFNILKQPQEIIRLELRCDFAAPRLAREALQPLAAIDPVQSDAVLVASELVSSAVVRAVETDEEIEFTVQRGRDSVRLAVSARGPGQPARTHGREPLPLRGLSLHVVETLAQRWGGELPDGTIVWAELSLTPVALMPVRN